MGDISSVANDSLFAESGADATVCRIAALPMQS